MTTIKELLGQGDVEKPKRNFLQENIKKLKEMKLEKTSKLNSQRARHVQPLTERRAAAVSRRSNSVQTQSPPPGLRRPPAAHAPASTHAPTPASRHVTTSCLPDIPCNTDNTPKGFCSRASQTLSGKELDTLYQEGVIRYPTARSESVEVEEGPQGRRELGLQTEEAPAVERDHRQALRDESGLHWDEERDDLAMQTNAKDYVRMNAAVSELSRSRTADGSTGRSDPNRAPPTYQRGVVPRYLKEHKKEQERERIAKAKEAADDCPEGHMLLPEEFRLKHLTALKQNYVELVSQLNQLPVSVDTLRTRTRKKQLETDLDRVEAAIALFSREKVFVRADS